jgi:tetratricopeptide (TPR) repeat protein
MSPFSDKDLKECNSSRNNASLSIIDFKRLEAEARELCNNDKLNDGLHLYGDLLRYIQEGRVEATDDFLEKYQSQICFRMGLINEALGRYENAIIYFRKSLQLFKECR